MAPPSSTATGMMSMASASERASEMAPTTAGDGTSPRMWIAKMLVATAVARLGGGATVTKGGFTGPGGADKQSPPPPNARPERTGAGAPGGTTGGGGAA